MGKTFFIIQHPVSFFKYHTPREAEKKSKIQCDPILGANDLMRCTAKTVWTLQVMGM